MATASDAAMGESGRFSRLVGPPLLSTGASGRERGRRAVAAVHYLQEYRARRAERELPPAMPWADRQQALGPVREAALEELARLLNLALPDAADHVTLRDLEDPRRPVSPEFLLFVNEFGRFISGDPRFAFNAGAHLLPVSRLRLGRLFGVGGALASLPGYVARSGAGRLSVVERGSHRARVRWNDADEAAQVPEPYRADYIRYSCQTMQGAVAALPALLFGLPAAHVEEVSCRANQGEVCEWQVTWAARPARVTRNRFGLGGVVSVAVLAYILMAGPGTGPAGLFALAVLPLALGWVWQRMADNHELLNQLQDRTADLEATLAALRDSQRQVVEAEKMASLGQLTAGVAHEINNPVNFLASSVPSLRRDIEEILSLVKPSEQLSAIGGTLEDLPMLKEEIQDLLHGMEEGARRTAEIVRGLRTFSRVDENDMKDVDLLENIQTTLMLLRERYYPRIDVDTVVEDNLPPVEANPGQLNQVFMNLLANAMDAIPDAGRIRIELRTAPEGVAIRIWDSGPAIPEAVRTRIFEPFFTTKPIGQGTGLGLSISYAIVQRHHGTIAVENPPDGGVLFTIVVPVRQPVPDASNQAG
jgi:signal transduction histidine kinase